LPRRTEKRGLGKPETFKFLGFVLSPYALDDFPTILRDFRVCLARLSRNDIL
jgi:hypothetical protein